MFRFAPSPTGDMHIGNLRAALINYAMAKKLKKSFFVRIEDTDYERNLTSKNDAILEILERFEIRPDFVILQSNNLARHREIAEILLEKKEAFLCGCSKEFLESKKQEAIDSKKPFRYEDSWADNFNLESTPSQWRQNYSIRFRGSKKPISFIDYIKGEVVFASSELDSFVIMRSDGTPTYNFACAVDDYDSGVDFIIRGEDHVSNTPRQIAIKQALERLKIAPKGQIKNHAGNHAKNHECSVNYAHLPILLGSDGKKLSKRDKSSSVKYLLESGYLASAITNYLLLLGNKVPREIFSLEDACEFIDLECISKSPALFDISLLGHINREHMKRLSDTELAEIFEISGQRELKLARLICEESLTLSESKENFNKIFAPKILDQFEDYARGVRILHDICISSNLESKSYAEFKKYLMERSGLKGREFFKSLRILLSARDEGIELDVLYDLISHRLSEVIRSSGV